MIISENFRRTMSLTMETTDSMGPPSTVSTSGFYDEGRIRDVYRVDPFGKLIHGKYELQSFRLKQMPTVVARLAYRTTAVANRRYFNTTVLGNAHGFAIPRCRFLLPGESQKASLINNALKGAIDQQVNLAMFIAELDRTLSLFAESARKIAGAANDVRKGGFARAARRLGIVKPKGLSRSSSFADNWLKYSYGWVPLVSDAVGMMRHLSQQARGLTVRSKSRVGSSAPLTTTLEKEQIAQGTSQHRLFARFSSSGQWFRMEQVILVFRLNDNFWDQVSRLGFTNPGLLGWEAVPLSFVVDWFANVGDCLGSLNSGLTLEFVTGSYTEYHRNFGILSTSLDWRDLRQPLMYTYTRVNAVCESCNYEDIKMRRSALSEGEVTTTFTFQSPFSANHAITASALVVQGLKLNH